MSFKQHLEDEDFYRIFYRISRYGSG